MLDLLKGSVRSIATPKAQPAPVPSGALNINVGVDLAATVAFLRAAKSQEAAQRHLGEIVRHIATQAASAGWQACAAATASNPKLHALIAQTYEDGRRDGARNIQLPADFAQALATAMRTAAEAQPTAAPVVNVNVPVPSVTVHNNIEQRPFLATPGKDGEVLIRPVTP